MEDVRWSLTVSNTGPSSEPVTLDTAKEHIREDGDDQDESIQAIISAVRMSQEQRLGVAMVAQSLVMKLDAFPAVIDLPRWPVVSVTSITYTDSDGATQTLAADQYQVSLGRPAKIAPAYGISWPATRAQMDAVTVTFTAGFGQDGDYVPAPLRNALLLRFADMYENREGKIVGTIVNVNDVAAMLEAPYQLFQF